MPSLTLGQAVVDLVANTARFNDQLAAAHRDFTRFANSVKSVAASLGVGLSVVGITAIAKQAFGAADALQNMSDRLGIGVERLQEFEYAARQSGASLDDFQAGMRTLAKALTDAAGGQVTEATQALERLKVGATDARGALKPLDVAFLDMADAIKAIPDPARQAAEATRLLGRGALTLLPMLKEGRVGLEAMAKGAREMGGVLDAETVAAVDKAGDEIGAFAKVLQADLVRGVAAALPAMREILDLFRTGRDIISSFSSALKSVDDWSTDKIKGRIADLERQLQGLKAEGQLIFREGAFMAPPRGAGKPELIGPIEAELARLRALVAERDALLAPKQQPPPAAGPDPDVAKKAADAVQALREKLAGLGTLAGPMDDVGTAIAHIAIEADRARERAPSAAAEIAAMQRQATLAYLQSEEAVGKYLDAIEQGDITIDGVTKSVKQLADEQRGLADAFGTVAPDVESADEAIARLLDEIETGTITLNGVTRSVKDLAAEQAPLAEAFGNSTDALAEFGKAQREAWDGLKASVTSADEVYQTSVNRILDLYAASNKTVADAIARDRLLTKAKSDLADAIKAEEAALTTLTEGRRLDAILGEPGTMLKATEELEAIRQELEKLRGTALEGGDTWERMLQKYRDTRPFAEAEQVIDALFQSFNQALATSIQGVIMGTQTLDEALRNLGQNVGLQMLQMGIKRALDAIEQMLIESIERGAIRQLIQLLLGLGISSAAPTATAGAAPAGSAWGTGVQHGGIMTRRTNLPGGFYGGEAGAEAIIPLTRGNLSQYGWGGGAGGGGQHMTVELINESGTPLRAERPEQTLDANGMQKLRVHIVKIVGDAIANTELDGPAGAAWGVKRQGYRR